MLPFARLHRPVLVALGVLLLLGGLALDRPPAQPLAQTAVPLIDIVAVVDDSGSMAEGDHPNDPSNLRYAAARLLIDLAQSGDRVDVISFNSDVRVVGGGACTLTDPADHTTTCPRTTVGEANRAALRAQLQPDGRRGNTRMDLALALARNLLRASRDGRAQYVFFLTDGMPYPAEQLPALYQVIDELGADGVQVFPILLGQQTAQEVTDRMVQRTNGIAYPAASAADLLNIYGAIYASIRPHLYVSVLESDTTGYTEFFTNDKQGITQVTLVLPRQAGAPGYRTLSLEGAALTDCRTLAGGVAVSCLQPPDQHYDLFRLTHNQAITGKWTAQLNSAQKILAIVQAQTDLTVTAPPPVVPGQRPSTHWSAARRGETLLIVNPLQGDKPVADLPISLNGAALDGHAYSLEGTAYWQVVPAPPPGARVPVRLQVGQEVTPIVLQQTVYLQTGDFPLLVVDQPQAPQASLTDQNHVRLQTHFEASQGLSEPAVRAVIRDVTQPAQPAVVYAAALTCDAAGACADEAFDRVEFGHNYEVMFVAQARFNGTLYGDFARAAFSTPNQVYVEGLPASGLDLATVLNAPLPVTLRAVGVGDFCTPQVQLELHRSETPNAPIAQANVEMAAPRLQGGQTYDTALGFAGLAQLPPGQYLGEVKFTCGDLPVAPAQLPVAYGITPGGLTLLPNGPVDFGALNTAGQTAVMKLDMELSTPDIISHVTASLISVMPEALSKVVLTTGPLEPVQGTRYRLPLYLTLRDADLPAVQYQGQVQVAARPGDVLTPPDGVFTILFKRPAAVPQTVRLAPNGPLDFGLLEAVGQTVIRPLEVELSDVTTPLTVTLVNVAPSAAAPNMAAPNMAAPNAAGVTLTTGPLKPLSGHRYQLPLFLTLQADLPLGQYHGQVRVTVGNGVLLTPADGQITLQFKRPTLWESVWARIEPLAALIDWWMWPFTPPAWPALICWPALLVAGLVSYRLLQNRAFDRELRRRRGAAKPRSTARQPTAGPTGWQAPDAPPVSPVPKPRAEMPPSASGTARSSAPGSTRPAAPSEPPPVASEKPISPPPPASDPAQEARRKRYRD